MGAITVRLTDELQALVDDAVRYGGHVDGEAYIQSLLMDEHARRIAALHAAIAEGEASGYVDGDGFEVIDKMRAGLRDRYRSSRQSGGA